MPIDINTLPVSGQVLFGAAFWGAISALALGPMVADRSMKQLGWSQICETEIAAEIEAMKPVVRQTPKVGCETLLGIAEGLVAPSQRLGSCDGAMGAFIDGLSDLAAELDPVARAEEAAREAANRRLERSAERSETRCRCAASVVASDRLRWGLYAGSLRVFGKGTEALTADLTQALHQSACAMKPEG
ncbi:MAG: hypothetical protein QNJ16_13065 [Rhodobacter sp.]|nr:hypothetical protein [Rhodobacter sp.]